MTQRNSLPIQPVHTASLPKRMAQGAGIALVLIVLFLIGVDEVKAEWGKLWMLRPLIVVPLAGAAGGAFYYFMDRLRYRGGWRMILAILLSLIGYLFVLWVGTILGLSGTLWN